MKEKKHWFLRYPLVPAFILPLASIIGVALAVSLILALLPAIFGDGIRAFREFPTVLQAVFRILLALIIILVMKKSSQGKFRFGFQKYNLWPSIALASLSLLVVLDNIVENSLAGRSLQNTFPGIVIALLAGFAPGFFEEVVCRGVVLTNMMQRWNQKNGYLMKSVLASGIAFGLVHLFNLMNGDVMGTLLQVCYASGIGIFFGAVFARTRNLWGTIILHSLVDFSEYMFLGEPETTVLTIVISIVITIAYTLTGLYLIRSEKQEEILALWEEPQQE